MNNFLHNTKAMALSVALLLGAVACSEDATDGDDDGGSGSNSKPSKVTLIAPADGLAISAESTSFSWSESTDDDGDEISYTLLLSSDDGESWTEYTTTQCEYNDVELTLGAEYIWIVKAADTNGNSTTSDSSSFTTSSSLQHAHGSVITLQTASAGAPSASRIFIVGDGYTAEECAIGGLYEQKVQQAFEELFAVEPFTEYQEYFTVEAVVTYSQESGATVTEDIVSANIGLPDLPNVPAQTKNTTYSTVFEGGTSTGVTCAYTRAYTYVKEKCEGVTDEVLNNSTVIMLVNLNVYAGTTYMDFDGSSVAICPAGDYINETVPHEGGGHGWGRLADEYMYYAETIDSYYSELCDYWRTEDPYYYYNISYQNTKETVHWGKYIGADGYESVSIIEGANYYCYGVYKAETISCMLDNSPYFSAPSREAIVRRIMSTSGLEFDEEDFIARDKATRGVGAAAVASRSCCSESSSSRPKFAHPILVGKE